VPEQSGAGLWRVCVLRNLYGTSRTAKRCLPEHPDNQEGKGGSTMNKDRIEGSLEQAKGKMKEVAGKATGDVKLESEGKAQQVAGKIQNAVGGAKDSVKEALDH
jgi:uncharacterized protein YjbJ (UPF0337 family)